MTKYKTLVRVIFILLLAGCDIIAVRSPEHIVQQWKVQIDEKSNDFYACLKNTANYLKFNCRIHYYKEDVALFPERYFFVPKDESMCFVAERQLASEESQCISNVLQNIKFIAVVSRQEVEHLEHSLTFKSVR
jgi:hypothetical protein